MISLFHIKVSQISQVLLGNKNSGFQDNHQRNQSGFTLSCSVQWISGVLIRLISSQSSQYRNNLESKCPVYNTQRLYTIGCDIRYQTAQKNSMISWTALYVTGTYRGGHAMARYHNLPRRSIAKCAWFIAKYAQFIAKYASFIAKWICRYGRSNSGHACFT